MKNKILASMLAATAIATTMMGASNVYAQSPADLSGMKKPFFDAGSGKFSLTANVGYVHNFASKWDSEIGNGKDNGGVGYGARLGWTHSSGFGISGDYLGFTSKWQSNGRSYENPYHILTVTPSYRFSFGDDKEWGLKVGLGVGMSLADVSWGTAQTAKGTASKIAGGEIFEIAGIGYVNNYNVNPIKSCIDSRTGVRIADSNGGVGFSSSCIDAGPSVIAGIGTITDIDIAKWLIAKGVKSDGTTLDATSLAAAKITRLGIGGVSSFILNALKNVEACPASGGTWNAVTLTCTAKAAGGKAKDDAGFVLAPEIALEYDNGLLHADINARYIHGLANVKYDGSNGTANQLQKSGPLAVFVGAGFGVNF